MICSKCKLDKAYAGDFMVFGYSERREICIDCAHRLKNWMTYGW